MRFLFLLFTLAGSVAHAAVVRVTYTAEISTVSNSPFGLDGSARLQMVSGYFQYDTATPDTSNLPGRGEYLHTANGDVRIELPGSRIVTGSGKPLLQIENLNPDTLRLQDGISVFEPTIGAMSLNGTPDDKLTFSLAITDSTGNALQDDRPPANFPFTPAMPHTFHVADAGGRLLMRLLTISVPDGPAINSGGAVDAASYQPKLAPGAIAAVFGSRLAFATLVAAELPLPSDLAGVRVQVDGRDAGLIFVAPGQINFQVPYETAAGAPGIVTVVRNGLISAGQSAAIARNAPGVFVNPNDGNPIVTKFPEGSLVTAANPGRAGDVLIVYLTGLGDLENPPASRAAAVVNPLSSSRVLPIVTVGGAPAQVFFSGLTPGFAGLGQINIQLPPSLPPGNSLELVIAFGEDASKPVMLPVSR